MFSLEKFEGILVNGQSYHFICYRGKEQYFNTFSVRARKDRHLKHVTLLIAYFTLTPKSKKKHQRKTTN